MADMLTRSKRYLTRAEVHRASSFYDPDVVYTRLLAVVEADQTHPDPANQLEWLDPLDDRFHRALDRTTSLRPHVYYNEPITTISHQYYGTTSAWFLILAFNGYLHPDEISTGQEIEIPDLGEFMKHYRNATSQKTVEITF